MAKISSKVTARNTNQTGSGYSLNIILQQGFSMFEDLGSIFTLFDRRTGLNYGILVNFHGNLLKILLAYYHKQVHTLLNNIP
jgi:hypothetical protein